MKERAEPSEYDDVCHRAQRSRKRAPTYRHIMMQCDASWICHLTRLHHRAGCEERAERAAEDGYRRRDAARAVVVVVAVSGSVTVVPARDEQYACAVEITCSVRISLWTTKE